MWVIDRPDNPKKKIEKKTSTAMIFFFFFYFAVSYALFFVDGPAQALIRGVTLPEVTALALNVVLVVDTLLALSS